MCVIFLKIFLKIPALKIFSKNEIKSFGSRRFYLIKTMQTILELDLKKEKVTEYLPTGFKPVSDIKVDFRKKL